MNTRKLINAINSKVILNKLSPPKEFSNTGLTMLKFLSGAELYIIDQIIELLKIIKKGKTNNLDINIFHNLILDFRKE